MAKARGFRPSILRIKSFFLLSPQSSVLSTFLVSLAFLGTPQDSAQTSSLFSTPVAIAQQGLLPNTTTRDLWKQIYQKLPDLPLENKYVSKETGRVNADSTLVSRLIQYHVYVKGRPPNYRLDWKLTMADYLGANEVMQESGYPGAKTLQQNPIDGDRAAITRLNRKQRDALVQSLANIFTPNSAAAPAADATPPQPSTTPNPQTQPNFSQPKPGDAQLLKP